MKKAGGDSGGDVGFSAKRRRKIILMKVSILILSDNFYVFFTWWFEHEGLDDLMESKGTGVET